MPETQLQPAADTQNQARRDIRTIRNAITGNTIEPTALATCLARIRARLADLHGRSDRFADLALSEHAEKLVP